MPKIYSAAELKKVLRCDGDIDALRAQAARMGKVILPIPAPMVQGKTKIGRNDLCFCGSGKKFKKCCLGATIQHAR